jgi:Family of unknown function (DUF6941)
VPELDYALLADSAQVSEGKTFILGGGVSILWRDQYPALMGFVLVLQLSHHRSEANTSHDLRIQVVDADGNPLLPEIQGQLDLGEAPENIPRNVPLMAPLVLNFPPLPVIQRPGEYAIEILLDGRHLKSLPFAAAHPPGL